MTKLKVVSGWEGSKHTGEGGVVHAERDSQRLPLPRVQGPEGRKCARKSGVRHRK